MIQQNYTIEIYRNNILLQKSKTYDKYDDAYLEAMWYRKLIKTC
jgi:hypothetical protein